MRIRREYLRLPESGLFRRIARRRGMWMGWTYWAEGRSRDGYRVSGIGRTQREAVNDLRKQCEPMKGKR